MAQRKKKKITKKRAAKKHAPKKAVEDIQGIGWITAERLRKAGYGTIAKLAQAQPNKLAQVPGLNTPLAKKLISSAKDVYKKISVEQPPVKRLPVTEGQQTLRERIISEAMEDKVFRCRVAHYIVDKLF